MYNLSVYCSHQEASTAAHFCFVIAVQIANMLGAIDFAGVVSCWLDHLSYIDKEWLTNQEETLEESVVASYVQTNPFLRQIRDQMVDCFAQSTHTEIIRVLYEVLQECILDPSASSRGVNPPRVIDAAYRNCPHCHRPLGQRRAVPAKLITNTGVCAITVLSRRCRNTSCEVTSVKTDSFLIRRDRNTKTLFSEWTTIENRGIMSITQSWFISIDTIQPWILNIPLLGGGSLWSSQLSYARGFAGRSMQLEDVKNGQIFKRAYIIFNIHKWYHESNIRRVQAGEARLHFTLEEQMTPCQQKSASAGLSKIMQFVSADLKRTLQTSWKHSDTLCTNVNQHCRDQKIRPMVIDGVVMGKDLLSAFIYC